MGMHYNDNDMQKKMLCGEFGLEKESLRVDANGYVSLSKHPYMEDKHVQRDFAESQVELVTDVSYSVDALYEQLFMIQSKVSDRLYHSSTGKEYLWAFSNPPYLSDISKIPVAQFEGMDKEKQDYREYLAEKYGKNKMLLSGIHVNFSFPEELLEMGYKKDKSSSFSEYKNRIYLELAKKMVRYSWLVVYLTAASPLLDGSFHKREEKGITLPIRYSSVRCSKIGYWNDFVPVIQYDNLDSYVRSIDSYVKSGQLRSASEFYYPVRLKPKGANSLYQLKEKGVNHIELRMIDVNPLSPVGIKKEDLEFLHFLLVYLSSLPDDEFDEKAQQQAVLNMQQAAVFNEKEIHIWEGEKKIPVTVAANEVLTKMEQFYLKCGQVEAAQKLTYQKNKIANPECRYADKIATQFGQQYVKKGLQLVKSYAGENNYLL